MSGEAGLVAISALQHWVFCPRQCGLIHLERLWSENRFTAEGRVMHEKAHQAISEAKGALRIERGLSLRSHQYGLVGVADVVEICQGDGGLSVLPVEYKRGKPKKGRADEVQLCAQALCLEEMLKTEVPRGALFYGKTKRRHNVELDDELRRQTIEIINQVREMLDSGATPLAEESPACKSCSMRSQCLPGPTGSGVGSSAWLRRKMRKALKEI